ncbi:uncharacterized protein [Zea mays]|uniref:Uncharacterized protein n=1 Tax=Zea mays TaxID=4577 RepID=A0A1D6NQQ3_MAIZE|nr:uncharacterized protein LOC103651678 [Zea mays]ONM42258.1 hypothetical protein ZEAMMB73_Zm00001d044688 [Zea mays]|eukprot:XP_008675609.1 uncharacterized protein LOC103651678 [Zea mays]
MGSTGRQQQTRLRPPRFSSLFLLLLVLLAAVFTQPSSCRPVLLVDKTDATDVILLPVPADAETTATVVFAAPSATVPREDDDEGRRHHRLAGGRHQWLLNKKPRGKAPPSAPSKRTN